MPESAQTPRATNVRWLVVAMLVVFAFLAHFNRVSVSVAGSERFIGPGKMTSEQMGMVYSSFLLVYTLGMLPGGWLIDRLGPRLALTGMGLGMGFCVVLTGGLGWAGLSIASLWIPLLVIRGIAGGLSVPLHPAAARSVALWVPLPKRAAANGLITAGALLGIAFCYPGFGWLMDRYDWPLAFVACGTSMMVFAVVWFCLSADHAGNHGWTNSAEQQLVPDAPKTSSARSVSQTRMSTLFLNRSLVLLTLSYGAVSYFQYLFFYWIEHYFEKELKMSIDDSRQAAFTVTIAMAIGMMLGGFCSDFACQRLGRRWGCRLIAILGMGLCAFFAWQGAAPIAPKIVVIWFSLALGSLGLCEGIFWTTAPSLEKERGGMACAFVNTVGNGVGLLAPLLTPWIGDRFGWTSVMAIACCTCSLGAFLWFWIDANAGRESTDASDENVKQL